jgi:hypothetical protein
MRATCGAQTRSCLIKLLVMVRPNLRAHRVAVRAARVGSREASWYCRA